MKNLWLQPASLCLGALLTLSLGARTPTPDEEPPFAAGAKLYRVEFSRPMAEILPELGPATVREVRGSWALVAGPGILRGPMWINSDQMVRFSFER